MGHQKFHSRIPCFTIQGRRKQFYIGQAESLDTFECMENVATHIYTWATCTAQSTISMQGILMLGDLGMPLRKILENRYSEIEFEGISGLN